MDRLDTTTEATRPPPDPRRWRALALLATAFFMVILDATIVLTAVPSVQADLGMTVPQVQWILTGYALAFGGLMLLGGRLADLLGRRRMFMAGLAGFALSSLVCGLVRSAEVLAAARAVQGAAAAVMAPAALSLVMTVFPEGPERNRALAIWGGLGGVGATAGLLVGGVITDGLGWRWVFLVNVPVVLVALALCPLLLRESRDPDRPRGFDVAGAVTITAALVLGVYAVVTAPEHGWGSVHTVGLLGAALALAALFVVVEARSSAPLVPLRVFRLRSLVGGNVAILAAGLAVDGMLFPLTLHAQQVLGYTALQSGLMSAVMTVMSIAGAFAGQAAVTRLGPRTMAAGGMGLMVVGCLLLAGVSATGGLVAVLPGLLVFGPGMGAAFVAGQIASLTGVADAESGLAAGLVDTSFSLGSAIGIAVVTSVATSRTAGLLAAGSGVDPLAATTAGLQSAFVVAAVFAAAGLVAALTLLPGRAATRPAAVAEPTGPGRP